MRFYLILSYLEENNNSDVLETNNKVCFGKNSIFFTEFFKFCCKLTNILLSINTVESFVITHIINLGIHKGLAVINKYDCYFYGRC